MRASSAGGAPAPARPVEEGPTGDPGGEAVGGRRPRRGRRGIPWARFAVVAALVALDLWSKAAVFDWLGPPGEPGPGMEPDRHGHWRLSLLGGWLTFMLTENPGAAFGQLGGFPHLLVGGRIAAVLVLAVALWRMRGDSRLLLAGVVLVLSGAAGNLYDNLFLEAPEGRPFGLVRDFIDVYFPFWDWHFPTFNVADSCITIGAACFLLHGILARDEDGEERDAAGEGARPSPAD